MLNIFNQNTDPVTCNFGFLPDDTATTCIRECHKFHFLIVVHKYCIPVLTAVKPDVNITHSNDRNYVTETSANNFEIEVGREFEVLCVSYGTYRGNVTWSKMNVQTGGKSAICVELLQPASSNRLRTKP